MDNKENKLIVYMYYASYSQTGDFEIDKTPYFAYHIDERIQICGLGEEYSILDDSPDTPLAIRQEDGAIVAEYITFDNNVMDWFKNNVIEKLMSMIIRSK